MAGRLRRPSARVRFTARRAQFFFSIKFLGDQIGAVSLQFCDVFVDGLYLPIQSWKRMLSIRDRGNILRVFSPVIRP